MRVETYFNVDFISSAQVKIQFQTFLKNKKIKFLGIHDIASTHEDLSIDVPINCGNDIDEARVISFLGVETKFNFELF